MNRLAGIIVAATGLLIAILSTLKVLPGMTSNGVYLILFGGLIIGLSFVSKPEPDGAPRMTTAETLTKIFYAPAEVFQNLRRHPRWLIAVLIMSALSVVYTNAFMHRLTPERVVNYAIDKAKEMPFMNDQARTELERSREDSIQENKDPIRRTGQAVNDFMGKVFFIALLAAIFLVFALAMGGTMNYWQAFSATAYAMFPVLVIKYALSLIILHLKDPIDIHPLVGQEAMVQDNLSFLVNSADNPVLFTLLSAFGILVFYRLWLTATGLRNAGEKVSAGTAWTAVLAVWLVGLVLSVIAALFLPSFLS
jgi:hypothetical protein